MASVYSTTAAAVSLPEQDDGSQPEEYQDQAASQTNLLRHILSKTEEVQDQAVQQTIYLEQQAGLLRQLLQQQQTQAEALGQMVQQGRFAVKKIGEIEKATHFMERRSDSASALQSDRMRHDSQAVQERNKLAQKALSSERRARQERIMEHQNRCDWADRWISLLRGSCLIPVAQTVLHRYAMKMAAQAAQDEADEKEAVEAEAAAWAAEEEAAAQAGAQAEEPEEEADEGSRTA